MERRTRREQNGSAAPQYHTELFRCDGGMMGRGLLGGGDGGGQRLVVHCARASPMPKAAATATASSPRMSQPCFIAPKPHAHNRAPRSSWAGGWQKFVAQPFKLARTHVLALYNFVCCPRDTKFA
jgi:hypothetical protein